MEEMVEGWRGGTKGPGATSDARVQHRGTRPTTAAHLWVTFDDTPLCHTTHISDREHPGSGPLEGAANRIDDGTLSPEPCQSTRLSRGALIGTMVLVMDFVSCWIRG